MGLILPKILLMIHTLHKNKYTNISFPSTLLSLCGRCSLVSDSHLLPLVDVADESGQAEQPKQAQDFGETNDAQRPGCPVDLRVQTVHHQEDVVHRDGRHKVHEEPALQVSLANGPESEQEGRPDTFLIWQCSFVEVISAVGWHKKILINIQQEQSWNMNKALPLAASHLFTTPTRISADTDPADGQKSTF